MRVQDAVAVGQRPLSREMSLYLDCVRFSAAFVVVLTHLKAPKLGGEWLARFPNLGFSAVIIFFVMSGFVIALVSHTKERTLTDYAASRMARLWSVLAPALVLTYCAQQVGLAFAPAVYDWEASIMATDHPATRALVAMLFANELWFTSTAVMTDPPAWSLGFEAWYYIVFACAFYLRGAPRIALTVLFAVIAGPKILILMPAWLLGVGSYHLATRRPPREVVGWLLFLGSMGVFLVAFLLRGHWWLLDWQRAVFGSAFIDALGYAKEFIWALFVGVLVAANFYGFNAVAHRFATALNAVRGPVRYLSNQTLSLYLTHVPVMLLAAALLHNRPDGPLKSAVLMAATLAVSAAFGHFVEPQRYPLRNLLLRLLRGRTVADATS